MTQAINVAKATVTRLYTHRGVVGSVPQKALDLGLMPLKQVRLRSEVGNMATLFVGWVNMVEATGYPLYATDELPIEIDDVSKLWIVASTADVTDEVQTVNIDNGHMSGTFTLTFDGQETAAINHNATASAVQTALEALSTIGVGNVVVTGGPGPGTDWTVTFTGTLSGQNVALMTGDGTNLVGGVGNTVTITETTPGAGAAAYSLLII